MKIELYTDGACRGNPGIGGWGAVIQYPSSENEIWGYERNTTNNRMELLAAIKGIEAVGEGCDEITLYTDSQYLCKGVTEWLANWKRNGWKTVSRKPVKNADLWRALDSLTTEYVITWCWVRGHSGNRGNERADELANIAIDSLIESEIEDI